MEQTFDYVHELLNRQMALRAKIEESNWTNLESYPLN